MKFILLIFHKIESCILLLLCFLAKSDFVLSQEEGPDWVKVNDVVYYGPKFVNEGQSFEILCRMSKFNAPKWTKNETPIIENSINSFRNREGIQQTRIEIVSISKATLDDSGYYRCNSFSRASHRLDVIPMDERKHGTDSIPQPSIEFEEIKEEDSRVELECPNVPSTDTSKILWYKNSVQISSNDKRRRVEGSKLIIEKANSSADAGDYMCTIDSLTSSGGVQFGQMIQLRAPIKVTQFPTTQSVVFGRRHELQCAYTGFPIGKIRWLIGNQKLSSTELNALGIEIRPNNNTHPDAVLIIRSLKFHNQNSYTCIVDNKFTSDETSVYLTVRENAIQTNGPSIVLNDKKGLTLSCSLTDEGINPNVTKFIWFKDGVPYNDLPENEKNVIVYNEKDYTLNIKSRDSANKDDIGIGIGDYICLTGDRKQNATIKVRTKPWLYLFEDYQKTNYKSANIIEGDKFVLRCEVMPEFARDATVKWYKYNESEHESDTKYLMPLPENDPHLRIVRANDTKLTLIIDKVKPSDRFYYVCEADNKLSTTNNTILLRVKDKLGALWPFLGIVGEVVILCTIIFVYEKRRIKPDFDESDNDHNNPEVKGTPDRSSKSQDVRQRK